MSTTPSLARPSSSSEALPTRRVIIWAWFSSGKNGRSDLRISSRLSNSRNWIHSGLSKLRSPWTALMRCEGDAGVRQAEGLALGVGVAVAGAEQGLAGHALRDVLGRVGRAGHHVLGELEGRERGDDGEDAVDVAQLLLDLLEVGDVLGREEVGDRLALVHGEQAHHGLAAEQVLVGDAVLVDLLVLVQVRVLAGGEVELRDAEAEHERDREADDPDDPGVLAEVDRHPCPNASHGNLPSIHPRASDLIGSSG